ncbi:MAG: hypothetical protein NTY08_17340 [Proteobacteria bacterium]|nr:hypothetical protein [Pseudomonadota bacterium]
MRQPLAENGDDNCAIAHDSGKSTGGVTVEVADKKVRPFILLPPEVVVTASAMNNLFAANAPLVASDKGMLDKLKPTSGNQTKDFSCFSVSVHLDDGNLVNRRYQDLF